MTNPKSLAGGFGYSKPFPLIATAFSLPMVYRMVAGVLTVLVAVHGLALATAINDLFAR